MAENQPASLVDSIRDARQRVALELRAQSEQIQKLQLELAELQQLQEKTEREASHQWDEIASAAESAIAPPPPQVSPDLALENVLGAVRGLVTSTIPEQVFEVLAEEAGQLGVRAAVFDVRGRAAWGASAHGFGPALSEKAFRGLIVPLNQDNPFRQVCETAGHVDASADTLRKNRNVLEKLRPAPHAPVLLLPIRSSGTVSAIFYADPGENAEPLPVNALKILAEFAGAQIDRLIALSGGLTGEEVEEEAAEAEAAPEEVPAEVAAEEPASVETHIQEPAAAEIPAAPPHIEEPVVETPTAQAMPEVEIVAPPAPEPEPPAPPAEAAVEIAEPAPPMVETEAVPPAVEPPMEAAPPAVEPPMEAAPPPHIEPPPSVVVPEPAPPTSPTAVGFDVSQLSEADQKVHKDAKRFARLLVSEIELYNKAKVADGRKNHDLYKRLKSDIDRSRQTFEKRFGKVLTKQVDYFHDELVRTLAANDSAVLGPEYSGPSA